MPDRLPVFIPMLAANAERHILEGKTDKASKELCWLFVYSRLLGSEGWRAITSGRQCNDFDFYIMLLGSDEEVEALKDVLLERVNAGVASLEDLAKLIAVSELRGLNTEKEVEPSGIQGLIRTYGGDKVAMLLGQRVRELTEADILEEPYILIGEILRNKGVSRWLALIY